jgi:abortive infection bacteriophage resistance protein
MTRLEPTPKAPQKHPLAPSDLPFWKIAPVSTFFEICVTFEKFSQKSKNHLPILPKIEVSFGLDLFHLRNELSLIEILLPT